MFETSIVEETGGRGALSFSSSLLLQCGLVVGVVGLSLWMPVALPEPPVLNIATPLPRFRNVVKVVAAGIERRVATVVPQERFAYVPPSYKPPTAQAASLVDAMVEGLPVTAPQGIGATFNTGDFVLQGVGTPPAPPPAKAPVREEPKPAVVSRVTVGGDVLASKLIHQVKPIYPQFARNARIQGVVLLHGVITREGRISQLRVVSGHPLLVKAALDAVGQWIYSPTLLNKQAVEVEAPIEVRFILGQ